MRQNVSSVIPVQWFGWYSCFGKSSPQEKHFFSLLIIIVPHSNPCLVINTCARDSFFSVFISLRRTLLSFSWCFAKVQLGLSSSLVCVHHRPHTWIPGCPRQSPECCPSFRTHNHNILQDFCAGAVWDSRVWKCSASCFWITHLVVIRALWLAEPSTVSIQEPPRSTNMGWAAEKGVDVHSHVFPIMSYSPAWSNKVACILTGSTQEESIYIIIWEGLNTLWF